MEADKDQDQPPSAPPPGDVRCDALAQLAKIRPLVASSMLWMIGEHLVVNVDDASSDKRGNWNPLYHVVHRELRIFSQTIGRLDDALEKEVQEAEEAREAGASTDVADQPPIPGLTTVPPILSSTLTQASSLVRRFEQGDNEVLRTIIIDLIWRDLQFSAALRKTSTAGRALAYLEFIGIDNPPPDFSARIGRPAAGVDSLLSLSDLRSPPANDEELCARAALLTSPLFNLAPAGYYTEKLAHRVLAHFEPQYTQAAVGWIKHAKGPMWKDFRHHLVLLALDDFTNNFTNLVLAYAADRWPAYFGWNCDDAGPRDQLTRALLTRDIKPVHFAAALGLYPMLKDIYISNADDGIDKDDDDDHHDDVNSRTLGPPLFCALYGENIFLWRTTLGGRRLRPGEDMPDTAYTAHRARTILDLIESGESTDTTAPWQVTSLTSICSLVFAAAYTAREPAVLLTFLQRKPRLDIALVNYIKAKDMPSSERAKRALFCMLLTALMDHTLRGVPINSEEEEVYIDVQAAIAVCFGRNQLEFKPYGLVEGAESFAMPMVEDGRYMALLHSTLLTGAVFIFKRLMLEPRFPAAMETDGHDTLLHLAVAGDHFAIVNLLLKDGASLEAVDAEGRTPLMVSESIRMVTQLVRQYHADTTATDNVGRNIWHLAGGSNDGDLMTWLCRNDPAREENIKARSHEGNTPLAEALLYVRRLAEQAPHTVSATLRQPSAAMAFFQNCPVGIDEDLLWCGPSPIAHVAAEWGSLAIINRVAMAGADFTRLDKHNQSALYRLPLSASPTVVARLQELCSGGEGGEASPIAAGSLTPAEAIFRRVTLLDGEDDDLRFLSSPYDDENDNEDEDDNENEDGNEQRDAAGRRSRGGKNPGLQPSAHPSSAKQLSRHSYELLLTPETLAWQDGRGRGLWERFCTDVLMTHPIPTQESHYKPVAFLYDSILTALRCLVAHGATADYERRTGRAAITYFDAREMVMACRVAPRDMAQYTDESGAMRCLGPLFKPRGERRWWNVEYMAPYMMVLLMSMEGPVANDFFDSDDAMGLFREASDVGSELVKHWLAKELGVAEVMGAIGT